MEKIRARENATAPGPGHRATGVERQVERQVLLLTALFVYTTAWRRKHRALTTPPPPFHTNLTGLHVDACLPRMNTLPANARLDRTVGTHMLTRHPPYRRRTGSTARRPRHRAAPHGGVAPPSRNPTTSATHAIVRGRNRTHEPTPCPAASNGASPGRVRVRQHPRM